VRHSQRRTTLSLALYYHSVCCSREKFPEIDWVQIFVPQSGGAVFSFIDRGRLEGFGALASFGTAVCWSRCPTRIYGDRHQIRSRYL